MNKYCVIGEKLPHTMSPQIHDMFFRSRGIQGTYGVREFTREEIAGAKDALKEYDGFNVTVPYKQTVIPMMDRMSDEATRIGAVNTVVNDNGYFTGYNTDPYGFACLLEKNCVDPCGKIAVVLGSGGAAKSVLYTLAQKGADVYYVRRDVDEIIDGYKYMSYDGLGKFSGGYLLVNTTPVGMYPNTEACPVDNDVIGKFDVIADVVYNPVMTEFVRRGLALGKHAFSGLYMLVAQAVGSQSIWRGENIRVEDIDPVYNSLLRDYVVANGSNIYLTGLMSCGKTTLGKLLAQSTGREFVDADEYLVSREGMTIPDMFEHGEDFFRERETRALLEISQRKNLVVATGGGVVTRAINRDIMRNSGIVVYIKKSVENIIRDVDTSGRPLLAGGADKLYGIFEQRRSMYESAAHFTVNNDGSVKEGLAALIDVAKGEK